MSRESAILNRAPISKTNRPAVTPGMPIASEITSFMKTNHLLPLLVIATLLATLRGIIGLQVHGVGNSADKVGLKVCFRNIRILQLSAN
jgi:hypothetical protein